jgi:hypothetical protein
MTKTAAMITIATMQTAIAAFVFFFIFVLLLHFLMAYAWLSVFRVLELFLFVC